MEAVKKSRVNTVLVIVFFLLFFSAIGSTFYKYLYTKNYDYLIEASCDSTIEQCFVRDCENDPDSCPPNSLSVYTQYYVNAEDFNHCADNSCQKECESGAIQCERIMCDTEAGDSCSEPLE